MGQVSLDNTHLYGHQSIINLDGQFLCDNRPPSPNEPLDPSLYYPWNYEESAGNAC